MDRLSYSKSSIDLEAQILFLSLLSLGLGPKIFNLSDLQIPYL